MLLCFILCGLALWTAWVCVLAESFLLELLPTLPFCSSSHNDRDMPVRYQTCWDKVQNKTNKKREKWLYFGQQLSTPPPQFRHLTPTYDTQTQSSIVKPRVMCYSQPCLVLLWEESVPLSRPFKWWPAWTVSHESSVQCVWQALILDCRCCQLALCMFCVDSFPDPWFGLHTLLPLKFLP